MRIGLIVVAVTTVVFAMSCGRKADPVCPRSIKPRAVSDVNARITGRGIDVSWTVDQGAPQDLRFRIFRSRLEADGCLTCPRKYELIDYLSPEDEKLTRIAGNGLSYRDTEVAHGYSYSYIVVTCNESDDCSDESNRADVVFP
jgi:hypothetical protein